jgi:hypothetical protein
LLGHQAPTFLPTASDDRHGGDDYCDDPPSPRWRDGLIIVTAVLGLAGAVLGLWGLGVVGAFTYRAVFGGVVLPTLPPLTAPENGPKKIVPNYGDARSGNSDQTSIASAGSSEKFISRWPADIQEPPKTAPIFPNTSAPPHSALGSGAAVPIATAPAARPPAIASPGITGASVPPPASALTPAPLPSLEPKKIHTVIIRSDR